MPKTPIDYSTTTIYKIVCKNLSVTECYVGHTTNLKQRKSQHKSACSGKGHNAEYKIYNTIRDNGGWDNWQIVEIENYPCENIHQAVARERYWYEQLNSKLNEKVPNRGRLEYRRDTADLNNSRASDWYYANYDYAIQCRREYYHSHKAEKYERDSALDTCECGVCISHCNMARHRKTKKHLSKMASKSKR